MDKLTGIWSLTALVSFLLLSALTIWFISSGHRKTEVDDRVIAWIEEKLNGG